MNRLAKDERGAVYVEFLLVFLPVFLIFLGLVQASLLYTANIVVRHAANTAARAAMVVLDDDPAEYDDEARNDMTGEGGGEGSSSGGSNPLGGFLEMTGEGSTTSGDEDNGELGGKRVAAIRGAAQVALLSLSPPLDNVVSPQNVKAVSQAIGADASSASRLSGAALYNQMAVAVTFPQRRGDNDNYRTTVGMRDAVTVRVSYLFSCAVPIVNRLICDSMVAIMTGVPLEALRDFQETVSNEDSTFAQIQSAQHMLETRQTRLDDGKPGYEELEEAAMPSLRYYTLLGGRYYVLRGEAVMPNHGAPYAYPEDEE
jgi:hypothetical protein